MEASYNSRCPAVKRLFREAQELLEATEEYYAQPLEDNLFEWHFTVRGPPDTEFEGGLYHGRIVMPAEYPMKPPNIIFLTPNGRFETNKKICLSISGHHPETWQPSWSIRTALLAIIGFMPTSAKGTIGSLDYSAPERAKLAKKSVEFECPDCGSISTLLKERTGDNKELQAEAREIMAQVSVTAKGDDKEKSEEPASSTTTVNGKEKSEVDSASQSTRENQNTVSTPQATSQNNLPGNQGTLTQTVSSGNEPVQEILMEGVAPPPVNSAPRNRVSNTDPASGPGFLYNIVLSSAVILFIALIIRRVLLMDTDVGEELEIDDVLV